MNTSNIRKRNTPAGERHSDMCPFTLQLMPFCAAICGFSARKRTHIAQAPKSAVTVSNKKHPRKRLIP